MLILFSLLYTPNNSDQSRSQLLKIPITAGGRGSRDRVPFRWNARLSVAQGVALALEHLHRSSRASHGIVPHGNLKSTNVLLDQNDAVLVTDYGLTSFIAAPIASQSMTAYKSPEYQAGKRISHRSDI